jgi:hypothetical protein
VLAAKNLCVYICDVKCFLVALKIRGLASGEKARRTRKKPHRIGQPQSRYTYFATPKPARRAQIFAVGTKKLEKLELEFWNFFGGIFLDFFGGN